MLRDRAAALVDDYAQLRFIEGLELGLAVVNKTLTWGNSKKTTKRDLLKWTANEAKQIRRAHNLE